MKELRVLDQRKKTITGTITTHIWRLTMKMKGRMEKWIPGRSRDPPEEGAIGGQGVFRPTQDQLPEQGSIDDNNAGGARRDDALEGAREGTSLNKLDHSCHREDISNLRGSTSSTSNSCSAELELLSLRVEEEDGIFHTSPEVDVNRKSGSSTLATGSESGRRRMSVDYMKVEQVCTMNIPTEGEVSSTDNSAVGGGSGTGSGEVKTRKESYLQSLRNQLSLSFFSKGKTGKKTNITRSPENNIPPPALRQNCNGAIPKRSSSSNVSRSDSSTKENAMPSQSRAIPSPNRKVTFDDAVLQEAENRKLARGKSVRVVRVRDAAVDTSDMLQVRHL